MHSTGVVFAEPLNFQISSTSFEGVLDKSNQLDVLNEIEDAVNRRLEEVVNPDLETGYVAGALNFLRKPDPVSKPRLSAFAFGPWSDWLYCSENCGIGETSRTRQCSANGEDPCPDDGTCNDDACVHESKQCQIQRCLTCANFANYCDGKVNTECKNVTLANGEVTVR